MQETQIKAKAETAVDKRAERLESDRDGDRVV